MSLVTNRALESQQNARQVDYKSLEFSDALTLADIHGQQNADGLQGFYAEYEGTLDGILVDASERRTKSCEWTIKLDMFLSMPPDKGGSSYIRKRVAIDISESFDQRSFVQEETITSARMDASTSEIIELLSVTKDKYVGEYRAEGLWVTRSDGSQSEERLIAKDALQITELTRYQIGLMNESKATANYTVFDTSANNWFSEEQVTVEPVSVGDGLKFWEINDSLVKTLMTKQGVEVWAESKDDGQKLILNLKHFESLPQSNCQDENF